MSDGIFAVGPRAPRNLHVVPNLDDASAAPQPGATAAPSRGRGRTLLRRLASAGGSDSGRFEHSLSALGPTWRIMRGIADCDALLVGPSGAFALTVAVHLQASVAVLGDIVAVDGERVELVPRIRRTAVRLTRQLTHHHALPTGRPVQVRGLVALLGAASRWALLEQPEDGLVVVLPGAAVVRYLLQQPEVLAPASRRAVAAALGVLSDERPTSLSSARLARTGIRAL